MPARRSSDVRCDAWQQSGLRISEIADWIDRRPNRHEIANYFLEHRVIGSTSGIVRLLCASTPQTNESKPASYSISAVIVPLTSFNVTESTPASFSLSKVTESPSSSTRLKSQISDFASFLKRT